MNTALTISDAKAKLGQLVREAMAGKEIFIRSGHGEQAFVQLVAVTLPDPIPRIPPGGLKVTAGQIALHETFPIGDEEMFER